MLLFSVFSHITGIRSGYLLRMRSDSVCDNWLRVKLVCVSRSALRWLSYRWQRVLHRQSLWFHRYQAAESLEAACVAIHTQFLHLFFIIHHKVLARTCCSLINRVLFPESHCNRTRYSDGILREGGVRVDASYRRPRLIEKCKSCKGRSIEGWLD